METEHVIDETPIIRMSPQVDELFAALSKAQGEMGHAHKSADNSFYKKKYADLAECIDAARPCLSTHGLCVVQGPRLASGYVDLEMLLGHSSGQWIACQVSALPKDSGPQSIGSVITYLRRYTYSAMTGLAADDDDGNAGQGLADRQPAKKPAAPSKPKGEPRNVPIDDGSEDPRKAGSAYSAAMARLMNFHGTDEQFDNMKSGFFDWLVKAEADGEVTKAQADALTTALNKIEDGRKEAAAA